MSEEDGGTARYLLGLFLCCTVLRGVQVVRHARGWLPFALAAVMVASACTTPAPSEPTSPTASPTPSPTYTCTATPAAQCTAEKAAEEKKQAADYAAAEAAYRAFTAERNRLAIAGGASAETEAMSLNAAGPYLTANVKFLQEQKAAGLRASKGLDIKELAPEPGILRASSPDVELVLSFCEDASAVKLIDNKGKVVRQGHLSTGKLYARYVQGRWKIWDADSSQEGSCGVRA